MKINKVMIMMMRMRMMIMIMTVIIIPVIYLFCNVSCSMNHVCKAAIHGFETET